MIVRRSFFERDSRVVAKDLIGTFLVHDLPQGRVVGRIVETEAYLPDDEASHAFRGETKRNSAMFGPAGRSYIYFIYGMHFCFNIVTGRKGEGSAVLIRALEPVQGIEIMKSLGGREVRDLCRGPGRLVEAFGIKSKQNGTSLQRGELKVFDRASYPRIFGEQLRVRIEKSVRVGLSKAEHLPYRFFLAGSSFVSRNPSNSRTKTKLHSERLNA